MWLGGFKIRSRIWKGSVVLVIVLLAVAVAVRYTGQEQAEPEAVEAETMVEADVVVVGGGGAGLAAATSAAENGASVILIEKAAFLGGNTVIAGGAYNAVAPERQANVPMNDALMDDLKALLEADPADFGDFGHTLVTLQAQINEYLDSGDTDYLFDSVELHMIHTYLGGKRTDLQGNTIVGDLDLVRVMASSGLE